jgi:hypothetical protein
MIWLKALRFDIRIQPDSDRFSVNFSGGDGIPSRTGDHQGFTGCGGCRYLQINFNAELVIF